MIFSKIQTYNSMPVFESRPVNEFLGLASIFLLMYFSKMFDKDSEKGKEGGKDGGKGDDEKTAGTAKEPKEVGTVDLDDQDSLASMFAAMQKNMDKGGELSDEEQTEYDLMTSSVFDENGNMRTKEAQEAALKENPYFKNADGEFDEEKFNKFNENINTKYKQASDDGSIAKAEDEASKITPEERKAALDKAKDHAAVVHETDKQIAEEIKSYSENKEQRKKEFEDMVNPEKMEARKTKKRADMEKAIADELASAKKPYDDALKTYTDDWGGPEGQGGKKQSELNDIENKIATETDPTKKQALESQRDALKAEKESVKADFNNKKKAFDDANKAADKKRGDIEKTVNKEIADENKEATEALKDFDKYCNDKVAEIQKPEYRKKVMDDKKKEQEAAKQAYKPSDPNDPTGQGKKEGETNTTKEPKETKTKEQKQKEDDEKLKQSYKDLLKKQGKSDGDIENIMKDIPADATGDDLEAAIDASAEENHIDTNDLYDPDSAKEEESEEEVDDGQGGKKKVKTKFRTVKKKVGKGVKYERWSEQANEWQPATKDDYKAWKKRQKKQQSTQTQTQTQTGTSESLKSFIGRLLMD